MFWVDNFATFTPIMLTPFMHGHTYLSTPNALAQENVNLKLRNLRSKYIFGPGRYLRSIDTGNKAHYVHHALLASVVVSRCIDKRGIQVLYHGMCKLAHCASYSSSAFCRGRCNCNAIAIASVRQLGEKLTVSSNAAAADCNCVATRSAQSQLYP